VKWSGNEVNEQVQVFIFLYRLQCDTQDMVDTISGESWLQGRSHGMVGTVSTEPLFEATTTFLPIY